MNVTDEDMIFVEFDKYCPMCKYHKLDEWKDPCNECLDCPTNENTSKPTKYESMIPKKTRR